MKIKAAVALVTGPNRGIAASIVDARVAGGSSRIYAAVRTPPSTAKQGKVVPMALDITDAARGEDAATRCQYVGAAHLGSRPFETPWKQGR
jgi:NAD(P)-dependent dehydrogenase (short-subunit alcohol dehydrogenase family)